MTTIPANAPKGHRWIILECSKLSASFPEGVGSWQTVRQITGTGPINARIFCLSSQTLKNRA